MNRYDIWEKIKYVFGVLLAFAILGGIIYVCSLQSGKKEEEPKVVSYEEAHTGLLVSGEKTEWKYLDDGSDPSPGKNRLAWTLLEYDDSKWSTATGDFGVKDGKKQSFVKGKFPVNQLNQYNPDGTTVAAAFFRAEFTVEHGEKITHLKGRIGYDDAVMVYINGELVFAGNTPEGGFSKNQEYGSKSRDGKRNSAVMEIEDGSLIKDGVNSIAVEVHQDHAGSSDIYFDFSELSFYTEEAEEEEIDVSYLMLEPVKEEGAMKINWYTQSTGSYEVEFTQGSQDFDENYSKRLMGQLYCTEETYCNTVSLTALSPDTQYRYRIHKLGSKKRSEVFTFRTEAGTSGFSALAFGDPQIGAGSIAADSINWNRALEKAVEMQKEAGLLLSMGDQSDSGQPAKMVEQMQEFRKPDLLKQIPTAVIQGNHEAKETVAEIFERQFKRSEANRRGDYYFTWQDTLFVALNTNSREYAKQQEFLHSAVEAEKPGWVIVLMHYSIFSSGSHALDDSMQVFRQKYSRIMSEENVDLVLSGHDHIYTRSRLMKGMTPVTEKREKKKTGETLYITLASATGSKYYGQADAKLAYVARERAKESCFTCLDVNKNRIRLETYRVEDGERIDHCELQK